ncbi:PREDICTED: ES1 protein homolog, mitochondrial-like [Priapulus caudatus]|uniref:ES1 protein homolog, mitochondrial-like n=1 Tax=Priapulus caudatus TaxID=37621 RepID=A0ABM1EU31_PRICU|nr:PREDICTED: ES1 protein homolog, mitochondrial-like [Priapulus caudatus]
MLTSKLFSRPSSATLKSITCRSYARRKENSVAVVLSGCGVYDGTEVHEASAVMVHLSRGGVKMQLFAPDIDQMHVVNHLTGNPADGQRRNVLEESARIGRGNVKPLDELSIHDYDAVIFPGGFGAAKNLSTFATEGSNMSVEPQVEKVLKDFRYAKKPIGLCCISPVLAAKTYDACSITLGQDDENAGPVAAATAMGATHHNKNATGLHIDEANHVITTPAFMCGAAPMHEVFDGIGNMVNAVLRHIRSKL